MAVGRCSVGDGRPRRVGTEDGVAAGEPLPVTQDDITLSGHAIEARVYAEDSFGGVLPQGPSGRRSCGGLRPDPAASAGPPRSGSTTHSRADSWSALPTTPCWARASPTAGPGRRPGSGGAPRAPLHTAGPLRHDGFRLGCPPADVAVELDEPVVLGPDEPAERPVAVVHPGHVEFAHHGHRFVFTRPDIFGDHAAAVADGMLVASMPGTVIDVRSPSATASRRGSCWSSWRRWRWRCP